MTASAFRLRLAFVALVAGCLALAAGPSGAATEIEVSVRVPASAPVQQQALERFLGDAAGGAPVRVVSRLGRSVIVRTTAAGFDYLSSDDSFESVSEVEPAGAAAAASAVSGERTWTIRLRTGSVVQQGLTAEAAAAASVSASLEQGALAFSPPLRTDRVGPGALRVSGLAADGSEVASVVVQDPRVIRYEAADAAGEFTEGAVFYRSDAHLGVSLPDDPRIAQIVIAAPADGPAGGLRRLATVSVR